jgi:hypothetical protein
MSERSFRFIQGVCILSALYFELNTLLYSIIVLLGFEGFTNWRIPVLVSRLRYGKAAITEESAPPKFSIEAERALRLVVFTMLLLTVLVFPEAAWFFPWRNVINGRDHQYLPYGNPVPLVGTALVF